MNELGPETSLGVSLPAGTVDAGAEGTPPLPTEPAHGAAGWATPLPPDHSPSPVIHAAHGAADAVPPRTRGGTLRVIVPSAVLSASLASGLTVALVGTGGTRVAAPAVVDGTAATASGATVSLASVTAADAVERVAASASPSVVTITTTGSAGASPFDVTGTGVGSGIVVSADGLILTNAHVVEGASALTVTLADGTEVPATVVARDAAHDLAVVRAEATGLVPATLATADELVVGQVVVAIGSPLGTFTDTVTLGIVSGLGRDIDVAEASTRSVHHLSGMIQTDAAINPGNSGGPLLDTSGRVVGIVTANASDAQGVGFAVPISVARDLLASAAA
jgi:putative serine protease PepD